MVKKKNYNNEFSEYIDSFEHFQDAFFHGRKPSDSDYLISELVLKDHNIIGKEIEGMEFDSCTFENVTFDGSRMMFCIFSDCTFNDCIIRSVELFDCIFSSCTYTNTRISVSEFSHCSIQSSTFEGGSDSDFFYSRFISCYLDEVIFSGITHLNTDFQIGRDYCGVYFVNSKLLNCSFSDGNLTHDVFSKTNLNNVAFINMELSKDTFKGTEVTDSKCFIDLQTIINSEIEDSAYKIFGVNGPNPKPYIHDIFSEIKFQSVFVSYSFDDRDFAHIINEQLRRHGVNTFLWERDAPGGKRLKKIMSENIRKHDRLLFIASQHSLQSEACQYELKEAREKQTHEWKDIYYPIHIDNYLFEVRKEDIPRKFREDFWENIEEVKEFHSKDFTKYRVAGSYDMKEFDEEVKKVIKDLKL